MRNNRLMTGTICAAILGAMITFHAYGDTIAAGNYSAPVETQAVTAEAEVSVEVEESSSAEDSYTEDLSTENSSAESFSEENAYTGNSSTQNSSTEGVTGETGSDTSGTLIDTSDLFSDRDLEQAADLAGAEHVTVEDGQTVTVKTAGVYVLSGTAANAQVVVEAGDEDKVQLVLDGVTMTNDSSPCIYVKNADKVFVTTASGSENTLTVSGSFTDDGTTSTDAVIFSKDDLVLNGTGTLTVSSSENGITSKDDLKVTGGTLKITCAADALEANDSIRIADGTIEITSSKDGLHAENEEDNTIGYVYIGGGSLTVNAADDAVHATTIVQVDGGTLNLTAAEGIEGTYILLNSGSVTIAASDDGINAGQKSNISTPTVEINGGELTITMGSGDTDAIDSNGNLLLNGGTLDLTAQSPFDYDGTAQNNGATIIVNGTQTDTITNQMMGGGMRGGMGGGNFSADGSGEMQGNFKRGGAAAGNWQGGGSSSDGSGEVQGNFKRGGAADNRQGGGSSGFGNHGPVHRDEAFNEAFSSGST